MNTAGLATGELDHYMVEFWEAFSGWIMKASNSYDDFAGPFFEEFNTAHGAC